MTPIILDQPHTHAGVLHAIGARIEVALHDAEWLIANGIARFEPGVFRGGIARTNPLACDSALAPDQLAVADPVATEPTLDLTGATS